MVIGSSGPAPFISCMSALPIDVTRSETCIAWPSTVPSQDPAKAFNWSKDFCAAELATGLAEDCPCPKAYTLRMKIDVAKIKLPMLLAFGDADAVRTAHAVQFFELLGGGKRDGGWDGSGRSNARLAILPGMTHYTIFSSPLLVSVVTQFLDEPMQQPL